jgi:hypothetical protein
MAEVREIWRFILVEYLCKYLIPSLTILELKCVYINLNVECL